MDSFAKLGNSRASTNEALIFCFTGSIFVIWHFHPDDGDNNLLRNVG
jgi:hypothetical protein